MSYRARRSQRMVVALCLGLVLMVAAVGWLFVPMFENQADFDGGGDDAAAHARADVDGGGARGAVGDGPQAGERGGTQRDGSAEGDDEAGDGSAASSSASDTGDTARNPDAVDGGPRGEGGGGGATTSGGTRGDGSSGSTTGRSGSDRTSSGRTWRESNPFDSQMTFDDAESADEPEDQPLADYWVANVRTLDGQGVPIAVGLFAPRPPHELRQTGLYGDGQALATRYADSDAGGRLAVPMHEVLGIIGEDPGAATTADLGGPSRFAQLRIGVFVDDPRFEPLVMSMPVEQVPTALPRILLTDAHYVEIRVREEVSNRALGEAEVELWRFDPAQPQEPLDTIVLRTDSDGKIMSRIMPGRSYAFRVRKSGFATSRTERFVSEERDIYYQIPMFRGNFLAGHVYDSGGAAVRDAAVTCIQPGWGQDETVTDSFGYFYVDGIPHGVYSSEAFVIVEAEGYATHVEQVIVNSENVVLTLTGDAGLSGIVHPSEGRPRVPTQITASQRLYGEEMFEHEFDMESDGSFAISGLIAGEVTLQATSAAGEQSDPLTIHYVPSEPQQVELMLNAPARLYVEVRRQDSQPIAGLHLRIGDWEGMTDAQGTVLWEELIPGEHQLRVVPDEPEGNRASAGEFVYFVPEPVDVELTSGETLEAQFSLSLWLPPGEVVPLEVRFYGEQGVGTPGTATLIATLGGGQDVANHPVTFEGGYGVITVELRADSEVPASHELRFEHPDYRPEVRGQEDLAGAAQAGQPLVINLVRAPSLSLQLVDRNGAHVEQVTVQLRRGGEVRASGQTDGVGRILFTHLEQGRYRIVAVKHAYRRAIFDVDVPIDAGFTPSERDDGSKLELDSAGSGTSADPTRLLLTMSNAGDVTIRVQTMHGAPAVGARVLVKRRHDPNAPLIIFDVGKIDGQGERIVRLHWDAEYQLVVFNDDGITYENFYNDPNEPIYTFDLQMEPRGTISGTVENPNGSPAENVEVRILPIAGPLADTDNYFSARTNSEGQWSIPVPANGTYEAICPDEEGTTPATNLIADTSNVTLVRGQ